MCGNIILVSLIWSAPFSPPLVTLFLNDPLNILENKTKNIPSLSHFLLLLYHSPQKLAVTALLEPLTTNKYIIKDSFHFTIEAVDQDSSIFIDSLFTNILLEETVGICTNELFKNNDIAHGLKKAN